MSKLLWPITFQRQIVVWPSHIDNKYLSGQYLILFFPS